jgi:hypothetical protein
MPKGFSEKLFKKLESSTEKFAVRVMMMDLIARLVGVHQVQHKNTFLWKYVFVACMVCIYKFTLHTLFHLDAVGLEIG